LYLIRKDGPFVDKADSIHHVFQNESYTSGVPSKQNISQPQQVTNKPKVPNVYASVNQGKPVTSQLIPIGIYQRLEMTDDFFCLGHEPADETVRKWSYDLTPNHLFSLGMHEDLKCLNVTSTRL
jgi:hypothetical protein